MKRLLQLLYLLLQLLLYWLLKESMGSIVVVYRITFRIPPAVVVCFGNCKHFPLGYVLSVRGNPQDSPFMVNYLHKYLVKGFFNPSEDIP